MRAKGPYRPRGGQKERYVRGTSEKVTLENVGFGRETEAAILITVAGDDYWIPFSQIHEIHREPDGKTGSVVMSEWIAKQKGLR